MRVNNIGFMFLKFTIRINFIIYNSYVMYGSGVTQFSKI
jgi:hypothetical protein